MKILLINKFHYLRGGSEVVYFGTANLLEHHGHKSLFFSMNHPDNLPCETSNFFMPYVDLVTNNGLVSQFKTAGRILYSFNAKKRLSKLLDKYQVDIAHLHNIHHQISPSILHELKKRKIPVVMTLHDFKMVCASYSMLADGRPCEACSGGKYFNALKNRCVKESKSKSALATLEMFLHHNVLDIYSNVDIFISPSLFLKNKLEEMGFKKDITHLPNFIDIKKFEQIKGDKEDKHNNSIVYFGRLSSEKGLWTLLKAAKSLNGIEIKIIGDGPIKNTLEEKVKREGIDNINFLGYMKGEYLYKEIVKSKTVVMPSEWYENNPMSVIEAFALSKPVIGSRIGGIPELVRDNETGFTFESGNAEDLSEKIKELLGNTSLLRKMGENARRFVETELNPEKHYQRLMEIYQMAMNSQGSKKKS
jgi:glycosyltransferase involved in cell wall biosynthesis